MKLQKGFTVVENLISFTIISLVLVVFVSFSIKITDKKHTLIEDLNLKAMAVNVMEEEINNIKKELGVNEGLRESEITEEGTLISKKVLIENEIDRFDIYTDKFNIYKVSVILSWNSKEFKVISYVEK